MIRVVVNRIGSYTHHGIGYTEHGGYGGTADNRWSLKMATEYEVRKLNPGTEYQLEVNGKVKGIFKKTQQGQEAQRGNEMTNMAYCRFQNTLRDLRDCKEHLFDELGSEEIVARKKIIKVCQDIDELWKSTTKGQR